MMVAPQKIGSADRVIVIGYGPVGKTVSRILSDNGFEVMIVELNIDTVRKLLAEGREAVYGDASRRDSHSSWNRPRRRAHYFIVKRTGLSGRTGITGAEPHSADIDAGNLLGSIRVLAARRRRCRLLQ